MRRTAVHATGAGFLVALFAACGSGTTGPSGSIVPPDCRTIDLAPGDDVIFAGASAVDCLEFVRFEVGTSYEMVVSSMSRTLDFRPMELRLTPGDVFQGADSASIGQAVDGPSRLVEGPETAWRAGQFAMDARLRMIEEPLLPQIRSTANSATGRLFEVPTIGQQFTYLFACVSRQDFPNAPASVKGRVRHVSDRAVIVEDLLASDSFSSEEYEQIGAVFDEVIYDTDVAYFGVPADIDGNGGRVVLLYTAGVNRLSEDYSDSFISGFTCPLDLGSPGGNRAEMFYLMVPDPDGEFTDADADGISKGQVRRITDNTVAHEFQHLINAQRGNGGAQDVWLNEGLSHLAEEVVGHAVNGFEPGSALGPEQLLQNQARVDVFNKYYLNNWYNLSQYLNAPADTAALLNASDPLDTNTFRMRGSAWSFVRYLLDRFDDGSAAEAARVRTLIASSSSDSRDAVSEVFGEPFDRLATQWSTMLVAADRDEVTPSAELTLPSYRIREVFESRVGRAVNPPSGGYPLRPLKMDLSRADTVAARLFPATGLYLEITSTLSGSATRVELVRPGSGERLSESIEPRIHLLRVR
jgi:hypothetical protein